jgi:DNA-binding GntR family transcriptional regulator
MDYKLENNSDKINTINDKLNIKSLREQVYEYLRNAMNRGGLLPGSSINPSQMSQQLGISKTPLRDALIQLETEGFVTILPRRGVIVNKLSLQDIKNSYEIVGALEAAVIVSVFEELNSSRIAKMKQLNLEMKAAIKRGDFDSYYQQNLRFHNVFLELSGNEALLRLVMPIKQRLYDFPRLGYIKEWELNNCNEHQQFIELIEKDDCNGAASIMRDVHWSFSVQEKYIKQFYSLFNNKEKIKL